MPMVAEVGACPGGLEGGFPKADEEEEEEEEKEEGGARGWGPPFYY
jgi:hypothetical protein